MTRIISQSEFRKHIPKYLRLAKNETIIVNVKNEPQFVLVSIHEYNRLIFKKYGLRMMP